MPVLDAVTGWFLFAGTALATGSLGTRFLIVPRAAAVPGSPASGVAMSFVARLGQWASAGILLGLALAFGRQLLEFRDPFAPLEEDVQLLLSSAWGRTWLWSVFAGGVSLASFWVAARTKAWGWWVATPAVLLLAAYPALTGHASAQEGVLGLAALAADTLHVLAVGTWMGGLAVVLLLERMHRSTSSPGVPRSLLPALVPAFSPVAVASVAILVFTGAFASWLHLDGLSALWSTPYGRLLSLKLLVVAAVLALGAVNWKRLTPRMDESSGQAAMRRTALLELALANVVLLVTALLVRTSPLGH